MRKADVSIIIPVYNVKDYLSRCLDSLLSVDGITATEILIVDDGSFDGSEIIADTYSERYDFIEVYHKNNGGLSDARNFGLEQASGKYVVFLDSDDMVISDGFAKVLNAASVYDADVLLWDAIAIDESDAVTDYPDICLDQAGLEKDGRIISGIEAMIRQIVDHKRFAVTAWLRACRREYLIENGLFFRKGLIHEDELWTPIVMTNASKVLYIPCEAYCYRIRSGSIMNASDEENEKHAEAFVSIMKILYYHYQDNITDPEQRKILLSYWSDLYLWAIKEYGSDMSDIKEKVPRRKIAECAVGLRGKLKGTVLMILGPCMYKRLADVV